MKSQNNRLLSYLQYHKCINPMQAWSILGIYRLGARIWDLKKAGNKISSSRITVCNKFDEPVHVAMYTLEV